jgi:hypothetical protein
MVGYEHLPLARREPAPPPVQGPALCGPRLLSWSRPTLSRRRRPGRGSRFLLWGKGCGPLSLAAAEFGFGVGEGAQRLFPSPLPGRGRPAGCPGDGEVAPLGVGSLIPGPFDLAAPLVQCGVRPFSSCSAASTQACSPAGAERGEERCWDPGVDADATHAQVPDTAAFDELASAGAVVAGGGLGPPLVEDGQLAAAGAADREPLQQRGSLPDSAVAGGVRDRAGVGRDPRLVGLAMVPRNRGDRGPALPPVVDQELADQLLARAQAEGIELLGPDGLLSQVRKAVLDRALAEEMTEHLG